MMRMLLDLSWAKRIVIWLIHRTGAVLLMPERRHISRPMGELMLQLLLGRIRMLLVMVQRDVRLKRRNGTVHESFRLRPWLTSVIVDVLRVSSHVIQRDLGRRSIHALQRYFRIRLQR